MKLIVCVVLATVFAYCIMPSAIDWMSAVCGYCRKRKKLYNDYIERRTAFEDYRFFMEKCEREHQIMVINNMINRAREMQHEIFH